MSSITVRNLDPDIKSALRVAAARHGWSMEQEARHILRQAMQAEKPVENVSFAQRIQQRFAGLEADTLLTPQRHTSRKPPKFDTE